MKSELKNKINNLMKITKNYSVNGAFLVLKDEGWSDGFMADLTNYYFEIIKGKAIDKNGYFQNKVFSFNLDREKGVDIKNTIPDKTKEEEVINVEFNLEDNTCCLVSQLYKVKFNPKYLKYFYKAYKPFCGDLDIKVTSEVSPITIYIGGELKGLIMPIRQ